jgi:RNA polymerase sigma factor (sigma-70 family)
MRAKPAGIGPLIRAACAQEAAGKSDKQLLQRFLTWQDEHAFAALVSRHGRMVFGVCRRVLGNVADAEDAFQATFLVLVQKARSLTGRAVLGDWLHGVARRTALKARSKAIRRRSKEQAAAHPEANNGEQRNDWLPLLDEEVSRLPQKYRLAVVLCDLQEKTRSEAAAQLGWPEGTVAGRLAQGRALLAERLLRKARTATENLPAVLPSNDPRAGMPLGLAGATVRAAILTATKAVPAEKVVSVAVIALVKGVTRSMFLTRLLTGATMVVAVAMGGTGIGMLCWGQTPVTTEKSSEGPALALIQNAPNEKQPSREVTRQQALVDRFGDPLPTGAIARLGTVRFRTSGWPHGGLGFLTDNKTVLANEPKSILFWEATTGKLLREIKTDKLLIQSFACSPTGKFFAAAGYLDRDEPGENKGAIGIWDIASGKQVQTLKRNDGEVQSCAMAFTPDNNLLVSLSESGLLRIEEIATGVERLRRQFPAGLGRSALSKDGAMLAVYIGGNQSKLFLWKWQGTEEPSDCEPSSVLGHSLAFSPDGKILAQVIEDPDNAVQLWDATTGRLLRKLAAKWKPGQLFWTAAFTPDGKLLVASGLDQERTGHTLHIWDTNTWSLRTQIEGCGGKLAFSPNSRLLATTDERRVRVWDLTLGQELAINDEAHNDSVGAIAFAGSKVVTGSDDGSIRFWDLKTGSQVRKLAHGEWVRAIATSPDATKLASSSFDDTVKLWDVASGKPIFTLPGHGRVGGRRTVAFTPDGKYLLSWGDDLNLRKWDTTTGKMVSGSALTSIGEEYISGGSQFEPCGKVLFVGGLQCRAFDVQTGKNLYQILNEWGYVESVAISPDSRLLLTRSRAKTVSIKLPGGLVQYSNEKCHPICLWELASRKLRQKFMVPGSGSGPLAFSPEGKFFAAVTGDFNQRICFWDLTKGKEVGFIQSPGGDVHCMAFTPDGQRLVTGRSDSTVLVWDLKRIERSEAP